MFNKLRYASDRFHAKLDAVNAKLDQIILLLKQILKQEITEMKELDDLKAQVAETTAVEQSAITLIQGLAAQIAANVSDPAALKTLSDNLKASADALASAVTANTASAPVA